MWIFTFYRLYLSIIAGLFIFLSVKSLWPGIATMVVVRLIWLFVEMAIERVRVRRLFIKRITDFKQLFGPYGIRVANKAESDWRTMRSLAEVFEPDSKKLKKTVEQLEVMDALFSAGMRPEGDEFLLHDLKLKYGKKRMEKAGT
jgi:hypothetical protein